jgi:thioester reductase-like protein
MAIFLTGSTGYLGSYLVAGLCRGHRDRLNLLVRAKSQPEALERLWQSLQLHMEFPEFEEHLASRAKVFLGDLTGRQFGLPDDAYRELVHSTDSVLHCAASLNRKSEKQCLNVNLRGTLEVIQLARRAQQHHRLRRFSHVSTVAVAGVRQDEVVCEDTAIDWARSDYDPYARTKKFCEHMLHELLPDVERTVFRPAIVLGDSTRAETTQFDMAQAFSVLESLPVLPLRPADRIDIVPADYVAKAIVAIHQKDRPCYPRYHLSSGTGSETYRELTDALARARGGARPTYLPGLGRTFSGTVNWLAQKKSNLGRGASLLKVFWPYLVWNTVFDNSRVVEELSGEKPAKFSGYAYPLLKFSRQNRFRYPARPWPVENAGRKSAGGGASR